MAEEYLPRITQSTPRSSRSSAYGGQVSLVDLAFQGDVGAARSPRDMPSSRTHSRREDDYVTPNTSRVSSNSSVEVTLAPILPRTAASWHAGNGSAAVYDHVPQSGITDESDLMEASDPALFQAAVEEHARRLGIEPAVDAEFLWIARESLVAPLPDGWYHVTASETGQPYYYNEISGESRWDHPSDDHFRQVFHEQKQKQALHGKSHGYRDPHPAGYYDTGGYQSMAWQDNEQDHQIQYAGQTQGWDRRQADTYYQSYEANTIKAPQAQVYSPRDEANGNYAVADASSTLVSSSRRQDGTPRNESRLVKQIEAMEEQKAKDDDTMSAMKAEVNDLKRKVASRDEDLEFVKSEVTQLQNKLRDFKQRLDESTKEREDLEDANQALKKELSRTRVTMEGNTKELEELLETHQTVTNELALAKTKLKEVELKQHGEAEDVDSLRIQLENERDANAQLVNGINANVQLEEQLVSERGTKIQLEQQLANEQDTKLQLQQQLEQVMKQQAGTARKLEAAQAAVRKLQGELASKRTSDQKENEQTISAAADAAAAAAATIKAIDDKLTSKEQELDAARDRVLSLQQELAQLQINHATTTATLEQGLQMKLNTSAAEAASSKQELTTVKSSLSITMAEKAALEKQYEEFKMTSAAQFSEAEDQQRTLKRELRAMERDLKTQQALSKEREDEIAALKQALDISETKLSSQAQIIQKERMEAYAEAQNASAEIVRQANEEKTRVSELYTQEMLARRKLHNRLMELQGNIRVFCRVRPIQPVELKSELSALAVFFRDNDHESLDLFVGSEAGDKAKEVGQKHAFEFDHVFQPDSTQEQVFEQTRALVVSALDGFNVCIFAYGQTGSGKTHTMEGPENDRGVNFRALRELFSIRDERMAGGSFTCSMKLSILEVYNETIVDLLEGGGRGTGHPASTAKGLDVRVGKTGVYVDNLIEVEVFNEGDVLDLMRLGHSHRSVGSHDFNEHSSRSHLVLSISIETGLKAEGRRRTSKLHLIDLAGSERVSKTAASGQRLKEAQNINRSLSALGDVIAALGANSKHVPYRNSKLTFLLQDSLSGNSKVLMFVNVSPVQWNAWETLCSLNFASRCRSVALGQAKATTATTSSTPTANGMHSTMSMSAMVPSSNGGGRVAASPVPRQAPRGGS